MPEKRFLAGKSAWNKLTTTTFQSLPPSSAILASMNEKAAQSTANELAEFTRLEPTQSNNGSTSPTIHTQAIEQLVESSMGREITAAAQSLESFEEVARGLMESSLFQSLQISVRECNASLSQEGNSSSESNKRSTTPEQSNAAPTSFSLFDLLDQQKGAFALPPRITADMVIDAYQRETGEASNEDGQMSDDNNKSCLDLLEKADDMEDLSPDPQTWEQIRRILYQGLNSSTIDKKSVERQCKYLKVHKSLLDICRRGNRGANNKMQCWDLAQNLVGTILSMSLDFVKNLENGSLHTHRYMNFYWDTMQCLLATLSDLALDYITSCVGDERQVERMVLGLCLVLANDSAACVTAALEPLAGWLEVWARFVPPKRMLNIVQCSGLGGVILQRCYQSGASATVTLIANALNSNGEEGKTVHDIKQVCFLQSLSILRTILYQCGASSSIVTTISLQFANLSNSSTTDNVISSFLTSNGVECIDKVDVLLNQSDRDTKIVLKLTASKLSEDVNVVFEPFHNLLSQKEVDSTIGWICNSSLEIFSGLTNRMDHSLNNRREM